MPKQGPIRSRHDGEVHAGSGEESEHHGVVGLAVGVRKGGAARAGHLLLEVPNGVEGAGDDGDVLLDGSTVLRLVGVLLQGLPKLRVALLQLLHDPPQPLDLIGDQPGVHVPVPGADNALGLPVIPEMDARGDLHPPVGMGLCHSSHEARKKANLEKQTEKK